VRKRARSLIGQPAKKKTTLARPPGKPPRARSGDSVRTLRNILFAYEPQNMGVVIGPVLLNGGGGSVPALHEFGGSHPVRHRKWIKGQRVAVVSQGRYPARPFMGPALAAEAPKFPSLWASSGRAVA
jgi:phage gpG-like protein